MGQTQYAGSPRVHLRLRFPSCMQQDQGFRNPSNTDPNIDPTGTRAPFPGASQLRHAPSR